MQIRNKKILDLENLELSDQIVIDKISKNFTKQYNCLIDDISRRNNSLPNKFSILTSRNNYLNKLFDTLIFAEFVNHKINLDPTITIVKTKNYLLFRFLKNQFPALSFKFIFFNHTYNRIKFFMNPYLDLLKILIKSSLNYFVKIFTKHNYDFTNNDITIIDTFLSAKKVDKNFIDRNYTSIENYLNENEKKNIYFLPTFIGLLNPVNKKKIINYSKLKIIFKYDFIELADYIKCLKLILENKIEFKDEYLNNYKLDELLSDIHYVTKYNPSTFDALINYTFISRIKEKEIKLKLFISWYENQPIDKGYIYALNNFYPNVESKGYQGFIVSHKYNLQLIPTNYEIKNQLCVDEIIVTGKKLKELYPSNIKVSTGPAFRFSFKEKMNKSKLKVPKILLLLPVGYKESYDLIDTVFNALKDYPANLHMMIKPHPLFKNIDLDKYFLSHIKHEITHENLIENLKDVSVVLGNTTSALVESLVNFTPVIVVPTINQITQNPIPENFDKRMWKISYSIEEICSCINYFIKLVNTKSYLIYEISKIERKNYFEKVERKNVKSFLNL